MSLYRPDWETPLRLPDKRLYEIRLTVEDLYPGLLVTIEAERDFDPSPRPSCCWEDPPREHHELYGVFDEGVTPAEAVQTMRKRLYTYLRLNGQLRSWSRWGYAVQTQMLPTGYTGPF